MPIYDIFETKESIRAETSEPKPLPSSPTSKDQFFSALTARVVFFLLLLGDIIWGIYSIALFVVFATLHLLTLRKIGWLGRVIERKWVAVKRSAVCGLSLLIALFSPALGIMVACTYFLMYDKTGIQEVVPSSLQEQFQEFFQG